jgi:hypothetical protein
LAFPPSAQLSRALATSPTNQRDALGRLARDIAIGLLVALAAVSLLTLLRAGALPHLTMLWSFAHLYGVAGYSNWLTPGLFGLPLVIYFTYVAAIAAAVVRAIGDAPHRVLTGMLMWAGVFGLGSASYYVARSEPTLMPMLFPAWALAVALLTVLAVQSIATTGIRRAGIPSLVVLFGMGLAVCSIGQFPFPWQQISRLQRPPLLQTPVEPEPVRWFPKPAAEPFERVFITSTLTADGGWVTKPGAPIALL